MGSRTHRRQWILSNGVQCPGRRNHRIRLLVTCRALDGGSATGGTHCGVQEPMQDKVPMVTLDEPAQIA